MQSWSDKHTEEQPDYTYPSSFIPFFPIFPTLFFFPLIHLDPSFSLALVLSPKYHVINYAHFHSPLKASQNKLYMIPKFSLLCPQNYLAGAFQNKYYTPLSNNPA